MRITSLVLVLLIGGGLYYWFVGRHDAPSGEAVAAQSETDGASESVAMDDPAEEEVPVKVVVIESEAQETRGALVLRGRTVANRNVVVAAETAGRVISEPLRRGSSVKKGQLLCEIEPGVRAAELAEAQASLIEAQAEADAAARLNQKGFGAEMTLKARQAQLQAAQARLNRVQLDIDRLKIVAPFDGVLESDTAELGTLLSMGAQCANVIDLTQVKVEGFVAEQEVDLLTIGQPAMARLINGVTATGQISFISRMADQQTRTFGVQVTLPNDNGLIRDGMTAELLIALPSETAHFIPQSALTLNDEGKLGVRLDDDGVARFVAVELLRDESDGFWVGGLPPAARVITIGQEFVLDGRSVSGTTGGWAASE
ncbi:MAG: efflux RND transporter periplasmic adaptor subunit [Pseudomonadota bacterium]